MSLQIQTTQVNKVSGESSMADISAAKAQLGQEHVIAQMNGKMEDARRQMASAEQTPSKPSASSLADPGGAVLAGMCEVVLPGSSMALAALEVGGYALNDRRAVHTGDQPMTADQWAKGATTSASAVAKPSVTSIENAGYTTSASYLSGGNTKPAPHDFKSVSGVKQELSAALSMTYAAQNTLRQSSEHDRAMVFEAERQANGYQAAIRTQAPGLGIHSGMSGSTLQGMLRSQRMMMSPELTLANGPRPPGENMLSDLTTGTTTGGV